MLLFPNSSFIYFSSASEREDAWGGWRGGVYVRLCGTAPICVRVSHNIWIHPVAVPSPIVFNRVPSQQRRPRAQPVEPQLASFSIHVFTQNSVKAAKAVNTANWGISGKQVSSHFILYESKHTPGLGWRTMPPERDAIHLARSMQMRRACFFGLFFFVMAAVGVRARDSEVLTSELITAEKLPAKKGGNRAG